MTIRMATVAGREVPLSDDSGVPERLLVPLRAWLGSHPAREVLSLILTDRSAQSSWSALGVILVHRLGDGSKSVGLQVSGMLPQSKILGILDAIDAEERPTICSAGWTTRPHPMRSDKHVSEVNLNLLQSGAGTHWTAVLWSTFTSGWFNQGSELILSFYETDVTTGSTHAETASTQEYSSVLQQACAWVIPLDESLGFLVGCQGMVLRKRLGALGKRFESS